MLWNQDKFPVDLFFTTCHFLDRYQVWDLNRVNRESRKLIKQYCAQFPIRNIDKSRILAKYTKDFTSKEWTQCRAFYRRLGTRYDFFICITDLAVELYWLWIRRQQPTICSFALHGPVTIQPASEYCVRLLTISTVQYLLPSVDFLLAQRLQDLIVRDLPHLVLSEDEKHSCPSFEDVFGAVKSHLCPTQQYSMFYIGDCLHSNESDQVYKILKSFDLPRLRAGHRISSKKGDDYEEFGSLGLFFGLNLQQQSNHQNAIVQILSFIANKYGIQSVLSKLKLSLI